MTDLSILDGNAIQVGAAIKALPLADLEALHEAESNGKTRKGVMNSIEELIAEHKVDAMFDDAAFDDAETAEDDEHSADTDADADAPAVSYAAAEIAGLDVIENCIPGSELSLGDGRKLAFGEQATVSPDLAAFLRERGQVK